MKYIYLLAVLCLWASIASAQSPNPDLEEMQASQPIPLRDFDLKKPEGVAQAFLYTANTSDYHYLRALCNPFVADYADIAEGKLNEICYWLPRFGNMEGSLEELKQEFAAMGKFKLANEKPIITKEGVDTFAKVKLIGNNNDQPEAVIVLQKVGQWWFLHQFQ